MQQNYHEGISHVALEPDEGHVKPRGTKGVNIISWPLEEVSAGLGEVVSVETQIGVQCEVRDGELIVTMTPPASELGCTDDQTKDMIGIVEGAVQQRLGMSPATDKSID